MPGSESATRDCAAARPAGKRLRSHPGADAGTRRTDDSTDVVTGQRRSAGFYRHWSEKGPGEEETAVRTAIHEIALAHHHRYGRPRITEGLRRRGMVVNHKRVGRMLREDNLLAIQRRKYILTTDSRYDHPVYLNRAARMTLSASTSSGSGYHLHSVAGRVRAPGDRAGPLFAQSHWPATGLQFNRDVGGTSVATNHGFPVATANDADSAALHRRTYREDRRPRGPAGTVSPSAEAASATEGGFPAPTRSSIRCWPAGDPHPVAKS